MTLNKKSISWHENGLKNRLASLKRLQEQIKNMQDEAQRDQKDCDKLTKQIEKAKELHLTEFDTEQAIMKK